MKHTDYTHYRFLWGFKRVGSVLSRSELTHGTCIIQVGLKRV